ncbi:hypothetical protein [Streptomyces microflavus]|uniref:hypothetical protein n=1 Tax=Streptomyces microflavus TaxID=1919 RepID=UPI0033FA8C1F
MQNRVALDRIKAGFILGGQAAEQPSLDVTVAATLEVAAMNVQSRWAPSDSPLLTRAERALAPLAVDLLVAASMEASMCARLFYAKPFCAAEIRDVMIDVSMDLKLAAAALKDRASNFQGDDLRSVELDAVQDLNGVLWDESTRWPAGWASRIRLMSVQQSPGHWKVQPVSAGDWAALLQDV